MSARIRYAASTSEGGTFDGLEPTRAAAAWKLDARDPGDTVWTGRAIPLDPKEIVAGLGRREGRDTPWTVLADPIYEMVSERISEIVGTECSETWSDLIDHKDMQELDRGLRRILIAWLRRKYVRQFYLVKDVEKTRIPDQDPTA